MTTAAPLLVVVQDRPTQFDQPFFQYARRSGALRIRVFYTKAYADAASLVDTETGLAPVWDHVERDAAARSAVIDATAWSARRMAAAIATLAPDLVIIAGYSPLRHALLAILLRLRGIPVGLRSDNTLVHSSFAGMRGALKRMGLPLLLRLYDSWHPVGSLARAYLERMGGASRPVFHFPYSADNDWLSRESAAFAADRAQLRRKLGWDAGDFVVLGVLKWHPREDPLTLIDAFLRLRERLPSARLLLVGDGPLREEVCRRLEPAGASAVLPGYVAYSELPRHYAMAEVFVHPAASEPWGVSVNEAMACGLPVIASDGVGAGADLIVNGATGYTFPVGDCDELARLLLHIGIDPELRARLRAGALEKIGHWNYARTMNEMLGAIACTQGRPAPAGSHA